MGYQNDSIGPIEGVEKSPTHNHAAIAHERFFEALRQAEYDQKEFYRAEGTRKKTDIEEASDEIGNWYGTQADIYWWTAASLLLTGLAAAIVAANIDQMAGEMISSLGNTTVQQGSQYFLQGTQAGVQTETCKYQIAQKAHDAADQEKSHYTDLIRKAREAEEELIRYAGRFYQTVHS